MTLKHNHRVALYLGWMAGGCAWLAAHLFSAPEWLVTVATIATCVAVTVGAVRWPLDQ